MLATPLCLIQQVTYPEIDNTKILKRKQWEIKSILAFFRQINCWTPWLGKFSGIKCRVFVAKCTDLKNQCWPMVKNMPRIKQILKRKQWEIKSILAFFRQINCWTPWLGKFSGIKCRVFVAKCTDLKNQCWPMVKNMPRNKQFSVFLPRKN